MIITKERETIQLYYLFHNLPDSLIYRYLLRMLKDYPLYPLRRLCAYFVFSTGNIAKRAFAVDLIVSQIIHVTLFNRAVRIEQLRAYHSYSNRSNI